MVRHSLCALAVAVIACALMTGCASQTPFGQAGGLPLPDPAHRSARATGFLQFLMVTVSAGDQIGASQVSSAEPAPSQAIPALAP